MMRKRMTRWRIAVALVAAAAFGIGVAGPASADATGYVELASITVRGVTLPKALLGYSIQGSGRYATQERVFLNEVQTCYSRFDFTQRGNNDVLLSRSQGSTASGCTVAATSRTRNNVSYSASTTKACGTNYVNGVYRNAACHFIVG